MKFWQFGCTATLFSSVTAFPLPLTYGNQELPCEGDKARVLSPGEIAKFAANYPTWCIAPLNSFSVVKCIYSR